MAASALAPSRVTQNQRDSSSALRAFPKRFRTSMYSQTKLTRSPSAAYHSMYFGLPSSAHSTAESKSETRLIPAIPTTTTLMRMLGLTPPLAANASPPTTPTATHSTQNTPTPLI